MARYDLTDFEWSVIEPLLPNKPSGVPRVGPSGVLNGIFWVLRSGAPWADLPERYGPKTILAQPLPPLDQGRVWDRIMDALTEAYDGHIQMIDGTSVRVHHSAATLKKSGPDRCQGRSRGGLTTKIHALTNRAGLPIRLAITPGQTHDIQPAHAMLEGIGAGAMLLADKAYDASAIRNQLRQQGVFANIQARAGRKEPVVFSPHLYKARHVIARFFNKLKFFRQIATRFACPRARSQEQARLNLPRHDQARRNPLIPARL